jgi:hypothetical protein
MSRRAADHVFGAEVLDVYVAKPLFFALVVCELSCVGAVLLCSALLVQVLRAHA